MPKEGSIDKGEAVEGSVVEVAFGPWPGSYFATSYPHKTRAASYNDVRIRKPVQPNLPPSLQKKLASPNLRYVMNMVVDHLAMDDNQTNAWHLYGHWSLQVNAQSDPPITRARPELAQCIQSLNATHISYMALGEKESCFFVRATDYETEKWQYRWGSSFPSFECQMAVQRTMQEDFDSDYGCVRAITYGKGGGWILYGRKWHISGGDFLPEKLVTALNVGATNKWTINKAVLNPCNAEEYVLVYNEGPVYAAFESSFHNDFRTVIAEWRRTWSESKGMDQLDDTLQLEDPVHLRRSSAHDSAISGLFGEKRDLHDRHQEEDWRNMSGNLISRKIDPSSYTKTSSLITEPTSLVSSSASGNPRSAAPATMNLRGSGNYNQFDIGPPYDYRFEQFDSTSPPAAPREYRSPSGSSGGTSSSNPFRP